MYAEAAGPDDDRPSYVRAASAIRRFGSRLAILQDDVNVLALHAVSTGTAALLLPAGTDGCRTFDEGRGNRLAKMDLEACAVLPDGRLVAFGSGSSAKRERLLIVDGSGNEHGLQIRDASPFYAALREEFRFAGSELNLEGALVMGPWLRLLQRGNGARKNGREPVNAVGDLDLSAFLAWLDGHAPLPALEAILEVDLGTTGTATFGFTDATLLPDGRLGFVACAEASPDAIQDGEVSGTRFGILEGEDIYVTDIVDPAGQPIRLKLEGIEARLDEPGMFDVVVDMDRPDEPAQWGSLRVTRSV